MKKSETEKNNFSEIFFMNETRESSRLKIDEWSATVVRDFVDDVTNRLQLKMILRFFLFALICYRN